MIIVEGKKLAEKILAKLDREPVKKQLKDKRISVITVEPNQATLHFIKQKQRVAENLGLNLEVFEFPQDISVKELIKQIKQVGENPARVGIIIQLPLPKQLDQQILFNAVPLFKDVDLLSEQAFNHLFFKTEKALPPVIGAINHIFEEYQLELNHKTAVVLGAGKLVGIPALVWLAKKRVEVYSLRDWPSLAEYFLPQADILISGLGKPETIKADYLKTGVYIFDAGYSVVEGKIKGDVEFNSASQKAGLITPVPGGIGPLTVACLFENVFKCYQNSIGCQN